MATNVDTAAWEAGENTLIPLRSLLEPSAFRDIVVLYELTLHKTMEAIDEAARRGDTVAIGRNAHDLAGLCGQLGSGRATALARRIESACADGDGGGASALVPELFPAVAETLAALAELAR